MERNFEHNEDHPNKKLKRNRESISSQQETVVNLGPISTSQRPTLTDSSNDEEEKSDQIETASSSRDFCQKWLKYFPWLEYEESKQTMYCKLCKTYQKNGKFVKGCKRFKIDGLRSHAASPKHLQSIMIKQDSVNSLTIFQKTFLNAQKEIHKYFTIIEYIIKENLAIVKYPTIIQLAKKLGVQFTNNIYQSIFAFKEILKVLDESIFKSILTKIKLSPYFSIQIDESTDITSEKCLIIYITYFDSDLNIPSTKFLKLFDIYQFDAKYIFSILKDFLETNGISLKFLIGFASDGAAVMMGNTGGVSTRLCGINPHLIINHCCAHRLSLALEDSEHDEFLLEMDHAIKKLYKYFSKSSKKVMCLKKWASLKKLKFHKILKFFDVRWLSKMNCIRNIRISYEIILDTLKEFMSLEDKKEKETSKILYNYWSKYETVFITFVLSDILESISKVFNYFQRRNLYCYQIRDELKSFKKMLILQYLTNETLNGTFYKELKLIENDPTKFLVKNKIKPSPSIEMKCTKFIKNFCNALLNNLNIRFPHEELFEAFRIFDVEFISKLKEKDISNFGIDDLILIENFFNEPKLNDEGEYIRYFIDFNEVKDQFLRYKLIINNNFQHSGTIDTQLVWKILFSEYGLDLKEILKLAKIFLVIPISSVECERGFSKKNQIKTKTRNRLKTITIDSIMRVGLNEESMIEKALMQFVEKKKSK